VVLAEDLTRDLRRRPNVSIEAIDFPVPWLTTEQMVEVDRAMIEDLGIELIQMMENAGRCLAHLARERFFDGDPTCKTVVVLAGTGGNGGGALVCARRLAGWGAEVEVRLSRSEDSFASIPGHQLAILRKMGVPCGVAEHGVPSSSADLVIDGLIGYSLSGPPRGAAANLIHWANDQASPVVSLDVPSGIDAGAGQVFNPAIRATATLTLAVPKLGLKATDAEGYVGELYLADIGVPPSLYSGPSLALPEVGPLFAASDVVRLE
jgi:NAD(P)H-hydrate epimerase